SLSIFFSPGQDKTVHRLKSVAHRELPSMRMTGRFRVCRDMHSGITVNGRQTFGARKNQTELDRDKKTS
ncbi:MAG: hypothetical protein NDJ18_10615, partial [candidate division Zixibacteria bacterium]|nr:hypothetical protein [candidate division Zixibacteria bacterium]